MNVFLLLLLPFGIIKIELKLQSVISNYDVTIFCVQFLFAKESKLTKKKLSDLQ